MTTLSPLLKLKVDELFLHWLSSPETQNHLRTDFKRITNGDSPPASPYHLSTHGRPGTGSHGIRPVSPPAPPPSSLTPPGKSPISPRRRTSSSVSTSSQHGIRKSGSSKRKSKKSKKCDVLPGCAKNMPQFFYPFGKPSDKADVRKSEMKLVSHVFARVTNGKATCSNFADVVKVYTINVSLPRLESLKCVGLISESNVRLHC